jgi:hypothetical protein
MEHTVHLRPEAERLAEAIAEAREQEEPGAVGSFGHLPDVLRDALARGLEQLAAEHGLIGPRPPSPAQPSVLTERIARAQLRIPDAEVQSIGVLDASCVELRTPHGDAVALERRTLERLLAILDHEDARRPR